MDKSACNTPLAKKRMKRKVVAISMPPQLVKWLRQRVADDREFTSVSDYIRELVTNDRERLRIKAYFEQTLGRSPRPGPTYTKRLR